MLIPLTPLWFTFGRLPQSYSPSQLQQIRYTGLKKAGKNTHSTHIEVPLWDCIRFNSPQHSRQKNRQEPLLMESPVANTPPSPWELEDIDYRTLMEDEIVIAVMGVTGAGKSHLIRQVTGLNEIAVGDGLESCIPPLHYIPIYPTPETSIY